MRDQDYEEKRNSSAMSLWMLFGENANARSAEISNLRRIPNESMRMCNLGRETLDAQKFLAQKGFGGRNDENPPKSLLMGELPKKALMRQNLYQ